MTLDASPLPLFSLLSLRVGSTDGADVAPNLSSASRFGMLQGSPAEDVLLAVPLSEQLLDRLRAAGL